MMKSSDTLFWRSDAYTAEHDNGDHFAILHDLNAGSPNRFFVFVWRVGRTAKIIGRELTIEESKRVVEAYPNRCESA